MTFQPGNEEKKWTRIYKTELFSEITDAVTRKGGK
jgi:hypothetical protein